MSDNDSIEQLEGMPIGQQGGCNEPSFIEYEPRPDGSVRIKYINIGDKRKARTSAWAKVVTSVDVSAKGGYAFEGQFLPYTRETDVPNGAWVVVSRADGSWGHPHNTIYLIHVRNGRMCIVEEADWPDEQLSFKERAVELVNEPATGASEEKLEAPEGVLQAKEVEETNLLEPCIAEKEVVLWNVYEAEFKLKGLKATKPAWLRELAEKVCREDLTMSQALAEALKKAKVDIANEIYRRVIGKKTEEVIELERPSFTEEIEVPVEVHGEKEEVPLAELPELEEERIPPEHRSEVEDIYRRLLRALDKRLMKLNIELDLVLPSIESELGVLAENVADGEISFDEALLRASSMAKRRYEQSIHKTSIKEVPYIEVKKAPTKVKTASEIFKEREHKEKPRTTYEYISELPDWLMEAVETPEELGEMLFYGASRYLREKTSEHPDAQLYADFLVKWLGNEVIQPAIKRLEEERQVEGGLPIRKGIALYVLKNYGGRMATEGMEGIYKYSISWTQRLLKDCNLPECRFIRKFASSHFVCTKIGNFKDIMVTTNKIKGYSCYPGWYYLIMSAIVEVLKTHGGSEANLPTPYRWEYVKFNSAMLGEYQMGV